MILDDFKLASIIFQIQYAESYEIWDCAGTVSRQLCEIWPELKVIEAQPQLQTLSSKEVSLQTGLVKSNLTLLGDKSFDSLQVTKIKETFDVWREELHLTELTRVSMRSSYTKDFPTIGEANNFILGLNLVRWPKSKVFDQSEESDFNGLELHYRFEDENSFVLLRVMTEGLKYSVDLDPLYVDDPEIRATKNRVVIDFDRGLLGKVQAEKFRVEEWFKGYIHILRRDIQKVLKA